MTPPQVENTAVVAPPSGTSVSSGTASEAMIRAAEAASSAAPEPTGVAAVGDTTPPAGVSTPGATAAATGQPEASGQPAATGTRGEAPEPRIVAAVKNARAEVEAQYAWARDLNQDDAKNGVSLLREIRGDAAGFVRRLAQELGLSFAEAPKPEVKAPWVKPVPALRSEDGKAAYTDEQVEAMLAHVKEEILGEVAPLREAHTKAEEARTLGERIAAAKTRIDTALTEARNLPHFKEHEDAIGKKLQQIPPQTRRELGAVACLHMAYNQVLAETVFPSIATTAEAKVRDEYERKAATSTGTVRPTGASGEAGKPTTLDTPVKLANHMEQLAASGKFG